MIYTLDTIPMSRFIEVYNGNVHAIVKIGKHPENDIKEAVENMINEYLNIGGGKNVMSELHRKNEMINVQAYMQILSSCKDFISMNRYDDVCVILKTLGYSLNPDDHDKIESRVNSLLANKKFQYKRLKYSISSVQEHKHDPDYFVKEMALVMTHFKMQIDRDKITAKEYAYIVKRMADEIDAAIRVAEKSKRR